jgi:hypothetical protein
LPNYLSKRSCQFILLLGLYEVSRSVLEVEFLCLILHDVEGGQRKKQRETPFFYQLRYLLDENTAESSSNMSEIICKT